MPQDSYSLLFKFGRLEHLQELQAGLVHMSPWRYFRDCEDSAERDPNEGTHVWVNPQQSSIRIRDHVFTKEGGTLNASLSFIDKRTKIFCASALRMSVDRTPGPIFDDRIRKHGDRLLVIWNANIFFDKVTLGLERLHTDGVLTNWNSGLVEYFDELNYDGEVGPFRKVSRYSFEKEWRLVVQTTTETNDPFQLNIGSIADHSTIIPTASFTNRIDLRENGAIQINI